MKLNNRDHSTVNKKKSNLQRGKNWFAYLLLCTLLFDRDNEVDYKLMGYRFESENFEE